MDSVNETSCHNLYIFNWFKHEHTSHKSGNYTPAYRHFTSALLSIFHTLLILLLIYCCTQSASSLREMCKVSDLNRVVVTPLNWV
jgi:hypothetical protein